MEEFNDIIRKFRSKNPDGEDDHDGLITDAELLAHADRVLERFVYYPFVYNPLKIATNFCTTPTLKVEYLA